jgi:hypothetical protein
MYRGISRETCTIETKYELSSSHSTFHFTVARTSGPRQIVVFQKLHTIDDHVDQWSVQGEENCQSCFHRMNTAVKCCVKTTDEQGGARAFRKPDNAIGRRSKRDVDQYHGLVYALTALRTLRAACSCFQAIAY